MPKFDFSSAAKKPDDVTPKRAPAAESLAQRRREFWTSSPINGSAVAPDFKAVAPVPVFTFSSPEKAASASSRVAATDEVMNVV